MRTITVVGASLAGLSAARALRAQGFDGRLVMVGAEPHRPYDRPPLSKAFLAGTITADDLVLEDDDDLRADWVLGQEAAALDTTARHVVLADGTRLETDGVVIATGARARKLPGATPDLGVHTVRTLDDAIALRADLYAGARVVVIGAGFIGSEVASTAYAMGCDVSVVEAAPTPLAGPLGVSMGSVIAGLHAQHGVPLHCGVGVSEFVFGERVTAVALTDGSVLPADVVVVGVGATPNVEWLNGSGITLGNGIECDSRGRTCVPGVVAVGDCAAWHDPQRGASHRVEHWTGALERPAFAVSALLDGPEAHLDPPMRPTYFWSDQYGARVQFAGHAADADSVVIEDGSFEDGNLLAVYRRGADPVGVLALNQPRLFGRWRRQLGTAAVAA